MALAESLYALGERHKATLICERYGVELADRKHS